ncbi:amidohydrolase family protein [Thalassobellus suaedae]|uniref:Amidohydrolase family protein n=1 Tax=Thalassobellus suaedae TaxID=3074124 RepID=A0ABY9XXQ5_9FLAO|nr:amidohydrolase family protein [Flavobacteriaceae bacterium HL-DH14]
MVSIVMQEIAKQENVYCKLSGMITEADYDTWTPKQLEPYMDLILNTFGTKRVMFGSDWYSFVWWLDIIHK